MSRNLLILLLSLVLLQAQAQQKVKFQGKINPTEPNDLLFLSLDGSMLPIIIQEDSTFSVEGSIQQMSSFFYFTKRSKKGKILPQSPRIWFDSDSVIVYFDGQQKTVDFDRELPFQNVSEKLEGLQGKKQVHEILQNPQSIPHLYFAHRFKENISLAALSKFSSQVNEDLRSSIYYKRLENYLAAKQLGVVKKGSLVQGFHLPDQDGRQISVSGHPNKITVIAFFSSGCAYSIASIAQVQQFVAANNEWIEIISIWDDPTRQAWLHAHATEKSKISWTNLWDEYGFASSYFNNTLVPQFYILNQSGQLIERFGSANQLSTLTKYAK